MSLILSGTDGLSDVDGSAATPAIRGTDANTGIFFPAADTIAFAEGGAEVARFDSSGNLGIGTSSPGDRIHAAASVAAGLSLQATGTGGSTWRFLSTDNAASIGGGYLGFNNGSYRMVIDSSGNLLVGTTSNIAKLGVVFDGNSNNGCVLRTSTNASGAGFLYFQQDTNTCGSVVRVGTTSAVTYSSTSDYRLKENVMPMTNGLDKVSRLKPVTYTWKQGGESAEGFIAHELAEVCPDAVVGTKDQVETYIDEDGNEQTRPKYQSIDTSFLVATLTAAIQELNAKVEAQAVRIAELEGAK